MPCGVGQTECNEFIPRHTCVDDCIHFNQRKVSIQKHNSPLAIHIQSPSIDKYVDTHAKPVLLSVSHHPTA